MYTTKITLQKPVYHLRVRRTRPSLRSNPEQNQRASCLRQLFLYHCYSISADAAVCNAESMSEPASQQQSMCRSLIRSVIRTLQAL